MDKQLIERIVDKLYQGGGFPLDMRGLKHFVASAVARIDAERGKEAVAFRMIDGDDVEYNSADKFSCGRTGGEPLFLSPTIPEGMALVPVVPTEAMLKRATSEIREGGWSVRHIYRAMLAAAQGERNAD